MNRRKFLGLTSTVGATSLAGCSGLSGDSSKDTDGDGVNDKTDYAPRDPDVAVKADVLNQVASTVESIHDVPRLSALSRLIKSDPSPRITAINDEANLAKQLPRVGFINSEKARVTIPEPDTLPYNSLLAVTRVFPRGNIISHAKSEPFKTGAGAVSVDVEFKSAFENVSSAYVSVFAVPPKTPVSELSRNELRYICESNPFAFSNGSITSADFGVTLPPDETGDRFTRASVPGGFVLSLSGRTAGNNWTVPYYASKSAYVARRIEERGRGRSEYATYAISNGIADEVARTVRLAYERETNGNVPLVEFVVDFVQALPYVSDNVGTGFDDYTKFPVETLVDLEGDCEDSTVLLSAVLESLGHDVILAEFPGHIGVAVYGDFEAGSHFTHNDRKYYYIETTGRGWGIGDVPKELTGVQAELTQI